MVRYGIVETPAASVSRSPLRVAVLLNATGHHPAVLTEGATECWVALDAHRTGTLSVVRVQSTDLRDAARRAREVRAEADRHGTPAPLVFLDVGVLVHRESRGALDTLARLERVVHQGPTLQYVGTPSGLAGFIADIHALGIADGVALLPLHVDESAEHVVDWVLEPLSTLGFQASPGAVAVARRFLADAVA